MSELSVTFLGTSAAMPTAYRALPATLVRHNGNRFLVDCGEGTQRQMILHGGLKAPTAIFFTHYHPDHDLGLPGLLASLNMMEHEETIHIYGPEGIEGLRTLCIKAGGNPSFAAFHQLPIGQSAVFGDMTITAYRTDHDVHSQGYIFEEDERPGRFDVERAQRLGIAPGPNYAKLQSGHSVSNGTGIVLPEDVIGPSRPGRKVVITGDTRPIKNTIWAAEDADLLVHEATFTEANAARAKKVGHTTVRQAIDLAERAKVHQLALTHFSPRELNADLKSAAYSLLPAGVTIANDGDTIDIQMKG